MYSGFIILSLFGLTEAVVSFYTSYILVWNTDAYETDNTHSSALRKTGIKYVIFFLNITSTIHKTMIMKYQFYEHRR